MCLSGKIQVTIKDILTSIFRDKNGQQSFYEPIAVIEYMGNLTKHGQSKGHYICDIKHFSTKEWYRTNDGTNPTELGSASVSKQGYVILYSRTENPNIIV